MQVRLRRALAACGLAACALAPSLPAHAESAVGGDALATRGTIAARGAGVPALPPAISARSFVVADLDTGEVLAARHPHGRNAPASTLKMLTAVALLPELDPTATTVARFNDVNVDGSKVGLVPDTRYSMKTLFESLLMVSGNDAANTLASAVGGQAWAVRMMNDTARRLRALDTVAKNPSGLDATGQVSSAYDLALIARAGLAMPDFARYVSTLRSSVNAPGAKRFEIYNHNKLLRKYAGALGVKNGYTVKARHSYVGAARRNGHTILVSLMRTETPYPDATALLDWGFRSTGRAIGVGRLADARDDGADEQADRSRPLSVAVAEPARTANGGGRSALMLPAGAVVSLTGGVLLQRRRRRRRWGSSGTLRLRLPVR